MFTYERRKRDKMLMALADSQSPRLSVTRQQEAQKVTAAMGLQILRVMDVLGRSDVMDALTEGQIHENLHQAILLTALNAQDFLSKLINGEVPGTSSAIRARYAGMMIAMAGHGPVTKLQVQRNGLLSPAQIEAIKARALGASMASGQLIEAEYTTRSADAPHQSVEDHTQADTPAV